MNEGIARLGARGMIVEERSEQDSASRYLD
jgi:hypothetical protein